MLEAPALRIHLAGDVCVEGDDVLVPQRSFPGAQLRIVFAMLAMARGRSISREEIVDEIWADGPPPAWDAALRAIVSKLRSALLIVGLGDTDTLVNASGCYQLQLPPDTWIDIEAAADAVHRAEIGLRQGSIDEAYGWTLAAAAISSRPFLPGAEGPRVSRQRD